MPKPIIGASQGYTKLGLGFPIHTQNHWVAGTNLFSVEGWALGVKKRPAESKPVMAVRDAIGALAEMIPDHGQAKANIDQKRLLREVGAAVLTEMLRRLLMRAMAERLEEERRRQPRPPKSQHARTRAKPTARKWK